MYHEKGKEFRVPLFRKILPLFIFIYRNNIVTCRTATYGSKRDHVEYHTEHRLFHEPVSRRIAATVTRQGAQQHNTSRAKGGGGVQRPTLWICCASGGIWTMSPEGIGRAERGDDDFFAA